MNRITALLVFLVVAQFLKAVPALAQQKVLVLEVVEENWDTMPPGSRKAFVDFAYGSKKIEKRLRDRKAKDRVRNLSYHYEDEVIEDFGWGTSFTAQEVLDTAMGIQSRTGPQRLKWIRKTAVPPDSSILIHYEIRYLGIHRASARVSLHTPPALPFDLPLTSLVSKSNSADIYQGLHVRVLPIEHLRVGRLTQEGTVEVLIDGRKITLKQLQQGTISDRSREVAGTEFDMSDIDRAAFRTKLTISNLGFGVIK